MVSLIVKFKHKLFKLPLGSKLDIKIPHIFMKDKYLSMCVIRGIFDTDGCLYLENKRGKLYPRVEFKMTSMPLAIQIQKKFSKKRY